MISTSGLQPTLDKHYTSTVSLLYVYKLTKKRIYINCHKYEYIHETMNKETKKQTSYLARFTKYCPCESE